MNISIESLHIDNFRKLKSLNFPVGKNITVISGQNGVGKSNILSLIASASGTTKQKNSDSNFQPDFDEYFHIYPDELHNKYSFKVNYIKEDGYKFTKNLRLKNDTVSNRGIRVIPTTVAVEGDFRTKEIVIKEVREKTDSGKEAKVPIPTKFLSLSRLYPIGEGEVESKPYTFRNKLIKNKVYEKYREMYNFVLPNSIPDNSVEFQGLTKSTTRLNGYFMTGNDTRAKTQSIGQDNLRHIISALLEFYLISKNEDYFGGILCIDELDSSLHPSAQIKLFMLLEKMSKELKLQIFVSSHSLTILKEIIRKNKKDPDKYQLVYLKGTRVPIDTKVKSYDALKADLFQETNVIMPKVKIYCEDNATVKILTQLIKASKEIGINSNLPEYEIVPVYLGCSQLKELPAYDSYFTSTCILLDGDARVKKEPKIEDYFLNPKSISGLTTVKSYENVVFLPNFFPPESYLYMIIHEYVTNDVAHSEFWRSLDINPETTLLTSDKIYEEIIVSQEELSNNTLKSNSERIFRFVEKSDILVDYYSREEKKYELENFITTLGKTLNKCNQILKSRRF